MIARESDPQNRPPHGETREQDPFAHNLYHELVHVWNAHVENATNPPEQPALRISEGDETPFFIRSRKVRQNPARISLGGLMRRRRTDSVPSRYAFYFTRHTPDLLSPTTTLICPVLQADIRAESVPGEYSDFLHLPTLNPRTMHREVADLFEAIIRPGRNIQVIAEADIPSLPGYHERNTGDDGLREEDYPSSPDEGAPTSSIADYQPPVENPPSYNGKEEPRVWDADARRLRAKQAAENRKEK